MKIPNSKEQHGKEILQSFFFGDTDIYLKMTDKTTGETYHDRFDFFDNNVKFID